MTAKNVKIGGTYGATVSGNRVRVRIDSHFPSGRGWWATNLKTGRQIHILTAGRLTSVALETDTYNGRKFNDDGSFTIL